MKTNLKRGLYLFCSFVLIFAISGESKAQSNLQVSGTAIKKEALPALIPFRKGNLMGYCDSTKRIVIQPVYDRTYPFVNGLGRVERRMRSGFVNTAGVEVAPTKYMVSHEVGKEFRNGRCRVQSQENWSSTTAGEYRSGPNAYGFLDEFGKEIVPPKYAYANHFEHGLAVVSPDMYHYGYINREGTVVVPLEFTQNGVSDYSGRFWHGVAIVEKARYGYTMLDTLGRQIIPEYFQKVTFLSKGLYVLNRHGSKSSLVNAKGEVLIAEINPGQFIGNYAFAQFLNGRNGFIDRSGRIAINFSGLLLAPNYPSNSDSLDNVIGIYNGLAAVASDTHPRLQGYVNSKGTEVIKTKYHYAFPFRQGRAKVFLHNEGHGFIDLTGKAITPLKYEKAGNFREGRAWVMVNNRYGFIDRSGKEIIPLQYECLPNEMPSYFKNGRVIVEKSYKFGVIDTMGREVVPPKYDDILPFINGLAKVRLVTRYGLINEQGREVVPPLYTQIITAHKDLIAVADSDGKWGFVDREGSRITEQKFSKVSVDNKDLIAVSTDDGKWGLINGKGEEVVPMKYRAIRNTGFSPQGLLEVELYNEIPGAYMSNIYIDRTGREYFQP